MRLTLRKVGNSRGLLLPKAVIDHLGLENEVAMTLEKNTLILSKPSRSLRAGWTEDAQALAKTGDDGALLGSFANAGDAVLKW